MESIRKINFRLNFIALIGMILFGFHSCSQETKAKQENIVLAKAEYQKRLMAVENPQIIDVRTPAEFENGYIEGAVNYNFLDGTFEKNIETLDADQTVFIYCASGARSAKAAILLEKQGFQSIIDLKGGYSNW